MIGCLRTRVRKQPIIALYFEPKNELKVYNLKAWSTVNVLKFQTVSCLPQNPRQAGQTQIRLLLKQSDKILPYLLFWHAFCQFQPNITNILFEHWKEKYSKLRAWQWPTKYVISEICDCYRTDGYDDKGKQKEGNSWVLSFLVAFWTTFHRPILRCFFCKQTRESWATVLLTCDSKKYLYIVHN